MQAIVTPAKYYLADFNLGEIKHQAMFGGGLHHQSYYKSGGQLYSAFPGVNHFAHVAFTRTTCSFSLLCSQPFLPFGCFLVSICTFFSTEVLSVRVPGGCRSNGCHGYCPGLLKAPFRFTRHLPHGFNLIFIEGIYKSRAFLPKATKKSA